MFEKELEKCGWLLGQPYWDWLRDLPPGAFESSPVFDSVAGFGGNGDFIPGNMTNPQPGIPFNPEGLPAPDRSGGGCVKDGPFKDVVIHLGPDNSLNATKRCIRRDFAPTTFRTYGSVQNITDAMAQPDFGSFWRQTEFAPHASGHIGVGSLYGDMANFYSSRE